MRGFERLLIRFTFFLCRLFDVTPERLEEIRRKEEPPTEPAERPDRFEA